MKTEKTLTQQLTEKLQGLAKSDLVGRITETGEDYFVFRVPAGQSFVVNVTLKAEK